MLSRVMLIVTSVTMMSIRIIGTSTIFKNEDTYAMDITVMGTSPMVIEDVNSTRLRSRLVGNIDGSTIIVLTPANMLDKV